MQIEITRIDSQQSLEAFVCEAEDVAVCATLRGLERQLSDQGIRRLALLSGRFNPELGSLLTRLGKAKRFFLIGLHLSNEDVEVLVLQMPALQALLLHGVGLASVHAMRIAEGLPHLTSLDLSDNSVGEAGARAIAERLPNLTSLNLWRNGVGDLGARAIAEGLPNLTSLTLASNRVSDAGARAIAEALPNLTSLDLRSNGVGEAGARAIAQGLPHLTSLDLSDNSVGEAGARAIAEGLPNLTSLTLWSNGVGDVGTQAIAEGLPNLTSLDLSDNSVGDVGARAIAEGLPNLTSLDLSDNSVGDRGARAIAEGLPNLTSLNLWRNGVGDVGARTILDAYQGRSLAWLSLAENPCAAQLLTKEALQANDAKALLAAWAEYRAAAAVGALVPLNEVDRGRPARTPLTAMEVQQAKPVASGWVNTIIETWLTYQTLLPFASVLVVGLTLYQAIKAPFWLIAGGALIAYVSTRTILRMFDREFFFRRMLLAWLGVGISTFIVGGISFALQLDWVSASDGVQNTQTTIIIWSVIAVILVGTAVWEGRRAEK